MRNGTMMVSRWRMLWKALVQAWILMRPWPWQWPAIIADVWRELARVANPVTGEVEVNLDRNLPRKARLRVTPPNWLKAAITWQR